MIKSILIQNPLGFALSHYQLEVCSILKSLQIKCNVFSQPEPAQSENSRIKWAYKNYISVYKNSKKNECVLVLWPILGYFDLVLLPLVSHRRPIIWIIHDPKPLTRALGYGHAIKYIASLVTNLKYFNIFVHSQHSINFLPMRFREKVTVLPHPILAETKNVSPRLANKKRRIRVVGQYKCDRDISMLKEIAQEKFGQSIKLEIYGRNWPKIAGWHVKSGFLSEDEFEDIIRESDLVIIPYRFFFQSGVAIRCLEARVPFMISVNQYSKKLLEGYEQFLLEGDIKFKINSLLAENQDSTIDTIYNAYRDHTLSTWLASFSNR